MNISENAVELLIDFIKGRRQQTTVSNVESDLIKVRLKVQYWAHFYLIFK